MISHDVKDLEHFEVKRVEIETERKSGFAVSSDDEWP